MRTTSLLGALCLAVVTFAQPLTVAEVYDYQPGDVFQVRYSFYGVGAPGGPPNYRTDSVQQRFVSSTQDTLFYEVWRTYYRPPLGPGLDPFYLQVLDTLVYTHLSAPATHHTLPDPCPVPEESIGYSAEYCGLETWVSWADEDEGCFEPDSWISELVRGCGGPYFWSFEAAGPFTEQLDLIYFKKGMEICGDLVTRVPHRTLPALRLVPNPTTGRIVLEGGLNEDYIVQDLSGRSIRKGLLSNGSADLSGLRSGQYLFSLIDHEGQRRTVPLRLE